MVDSLSRYPRPEEFTLSGIYFKHEALCLKYRHASIDANVMSVLHVARPWHMDSRRPAFRRARGLPSR